MPMIHTVGDLRTYLGASGSSASALSGSLCCGDDSLSSLAFLPVGGGWQRHGDTVEFPDDTPLVEVVLSVTVEGTDAQWSITLPAAATAAEYDNAMADLESYAEDVLMDLDA